jgi:hypothetical protein
VPKVDGPAIGDIAGLLFDHFVADGQQFIGNILPSALAALRFGRDQLPEPFRRPASRAAGLTPTTESPLVVKWNGTGS